MEFLPFNVEIIFAFILCLFILWKIGKRRATNIGASVNLPPGPTKLPIIGSLHHLVGLLPHHTLRDLANKYGGLMHLQLGEVPVVVISSTEFAKEVMVTKQANFASRPYIMAAEIMSYNCKSAAFAPYGEYWRQLRKIYSLELLSAKRVKSFSPIREDELTRLVKMIASKEGFPIDIRREVDSTIHTITCKAAFGQTCEDQEQFISIVAKFIPEVAGGYNIADLYPSAKWLHYVTGARAKLMKLRRRADTIMEKIIDQHKMKKPKTGEDGEVEVVDLLDVILRYQHPNEDNFYLTTDDIKAILLEVFTAGGDNSTIVVEWAMSEMLKNPRVMMKAQSEVREVCDRLGKVDETCISEMHYLKSVVKETLRLHPPGPLLLPIETAQNCKIGGYDIPMNTKIIVNAWALGRDSNYWTDPERFLPERFVGDSVDYRGSHLQYIPFGAGRRMCPGITFGLSTVENVLALLLYYFNWKLPKGVKNEDLDMTETFAGAVRRKYELELIPIVVHSPIA